MATRKASLQVSELDFEEIRANLKEFLRQQEEFQDYDFEGSGMAVLLDILAYNTHYMSYYLNMVGNEMFLDSAQLRNSVVSHAKLMNYVPSSVEGAEAKVNIVVTPSATEDQDATSLTMERYTRFMGTSVDGINYPFVVLTTNTATKSSGSFTFSNVSIKQGEVVTLQYRMTAGKANGNRRFDIPSSNVDTQTISVSVQESVTNTDTIVYSQADDLTTLLPNSTVYFLEENENSEYSIYFGDDIIGRKPDVGNVILVTYLDSVGSISNGIGSFVATDGIGDYTDNVEIETVTSSLGAKDIETVQQIKHRAPIFYSTQNRAVTDKDYKTLILKDFKNIDSVAVWGGEDNDPIIYGKVFISLKTKGNYFLTNLEKERVKESLIRNRNVMTVTPEILDPDYVFLIIKGKIFYDPKLTSSDQDSILTLVKAAVSDYVDDELNNFNSIFRKSKLLEYIENAEASITGSDIEVYVQKRFLVDVNNKTKYEIEFKMPLEPSVLEDRLISYPEFQIYDSSNTERDAYIEEIPVIKTGIRDIQILDPGINYTSAPKITISGDGLGAKAEATLSGTRLSKITVTDSGRNYTHATVSITGGSPGYGASAKANLEKDITDLRTFYYRDNGSKIIISSNDVGTVNYNTGKITINAIRIFSVESNDFYEDDYLTISAKLKDSNIYPIRNRIITLDENDSRSIQLQMVAE